MTHHFFDRSDRRVRTLAAAFVLSTLTFAVMARTLPNGLADLQEMGMSSTYPSAASVGPVYTISPLRRPPPPHTNGMPPSLPANTGLPPSSIASVSVDMPSSAPYFWYNVTVPGAPIVRPDMPLPARPVARAQPHEIALPPSSSGMHAAAPKRRSAGASVRPSGTQVVHAPLSPRIQQRLNRRLQRHASPSL